MAVTLFRTFLYYVKFISLLNVVYLLHAASRLLISLTLDPIVPVPRLIRTAGPDRYK